MITNMLKMAVIAALALTSLSDALTLNTRALDDDCETELQQCIKDCDD